MKEQSRGQFGVTVEIGIAGGTVVTGTIEGTERVVNQPLGGEALGVFLCTGPQLSVEHHAEVAAGPESRNHRTFNERDVGDRLSALQPAGRFHFAHAELECGRVLVIEPRVAEDRSRTAELWREQKIKVAEDRAFENGPDATQKESVVALDAAVLGIPTGVRLKQTTDAECEVGVSGAHDKTGGAHGEAGGRFRWLGSVRFRGCGDGFRFPCSQEFLQLLDPLFEGADSIIALIALSCKDRPGGQHGDECGVNCFHGNR